MTKTSHAIGIVHKTIQEIWIDDISSDYQNLFLLKEDTMKNAFYFHLRRRLGDDFLKDNNLALFTEYFIPKLNQKIDLVVVEIDPLKARNNYLGDAVTKIIAIIEMKYKGKYVQDAVFEDDIEKVLTYSQYFSEDYTKFYVAFIREKAFYADEVTCFVEDDKVDLAKNKLIEMLAYRIKDEDIVEWVTIEH